MAHRTPQDTDTARILAAVARETRPYTDPQADYPLAEVARSAQLAGAALRRRTHTPAASSGATA